MKIVVACDSFKGSLPARGVCEAIAEGLRRERTDLEIVMLPLADGGEGTIAAVLDTLAGRWVTVDVMGPLPQMLVEAGYARFAHPLCALVEMAQASGLELLRPDQRDPLRATTYGTGQLLKAAFSHEEPVLLAVGGSATVDGGVGSAMALGWRFLDAKGEDIGLGGAALERIARIEAPPDWRCPPVTVLTDVDHPLCGPRGAARTFAPQKGARPDEVRRLERALENFARVVQHDLGVALADVPGGGAAGGLAAGAVAFLGARLRSGIEWVRESIGLCSQMADADWVITGEGCFDATSLRGKVISGVLEDARETGTRVAVVAGSVALEEPAWRAAGVSAVFPLVGEGVTVEVAIARAAALLADRAAAFAATLPRAV